VSPLFQFTIITSKYFEEATKYIEKLRLHKNAFQLWKDSSQGYTVRLPLRFKASADSHIGAHGRGLCFVVMNDDARIGGRFYFRVHQLCYTTGGGNYFGGK